MPSSSVSALQTRIAACTLCSEHLPLGPRPVVQFSATSRIVIVGQAPGRRVHESGIPFDDPSGDRLRRWLGLDREAFYDASIVAVIPAGFCYPGTGKSGDLPPRPECPPKWHAEVFAQLPQERLSFVLGSYAQRLLLGDRYRGSVSATVEAWREFVPEFLPMSHPSPRNQRWFKERPWFEADVVPRIQRSVAAGHWIED